MAGSIPTRGKLFAEINLPFTAKQHKNDNIANFVYYGKTLLHAREVPIAFFHTDGMARS